MSRSREAGKVSTGGSAPGESRNDLGGNTLRNCDREEFLSTEAAMGCEGLVN
jgi:hypothetical protein